MQTYSFPLTDQNIFLTLCVSNLNAGKTLVLQNSTLFLISMFIDPKKVHKTGLMPILQGVKAESGNCLSSNFERNQCLC